MKLRIKFLVFMYGSDIGTALMRGPINKIRNIYNRLNCMIYKFPCCYPKCKNRATWYMRYIGCCDEHKEYCRTATIAEYQLTKTGQEYISKVL